MTSCRVYCTHRLTRNCNVFLIALHNVLCFSPLFQCAKAARHQTTKRTSEICGEQLCGVSCPGSTSKRDSHTSKPPKILGHKFAKPLLLLVMQFDSPATEVPESQKNIRGMPSTTSRQRTMDKASRWFPTGLSCNKVLCAIWYDNQQSLHHHRTTPLGLEEPLHHHTLISPSLFFSQSKFSTRCLVLLPSQVLFKTCQTFTWK